MSRLATGYGVSRLTDVRQLPALLGLMTASEHPTAAPRPRARVPVEAALVAPPLRHRGFRPAAGGRA